MRYTIQRGINHQKVDAGFLSKIILSNEAHFHLDGLIAKIAVFEVQRTHVRLAKNKCTHNVSLFGADFGQEASSNHIFLRIRLVKQLLMVLDIAT